MVDQNILDKIQDAKERHLRFLDLSFRNNDEEGISIDDENFLTNTFGNTITSLVQTEKYIIASSCDRTVKVWNKKTHKLHKVFDHPERVLEIFLSADHQKIIAVCYDGYVLQWNIEDGRCCGSLNANVYGITSVTVSKDSLVIASYDSLIRVWSLKTNQCEKTLVGHAGCINSVVALEDKIISASIDKTIRVWDLGTGKCEKVLNVKSTNVLYLAIKENSVVSGTSDGVIRIWNVETGKCEKTISTNLEWISKIKINDNRLIYGGSDRSIHVIDLINWKEAKFDNDRSVTINCLDVHKDKLVTGHVDGLIQEYNLSTREVEKTFINALIQEYVVSSNEKITEIPEELIKLKDLEILWINGHRIEEEEIKKSFELIEKDLKVYIDQKEYLLEPKYSESIDLIPKSDSNMSVAKDFLDKTIYIESIAKIICSKKTETPISIGLFAPWGEGKSTFTRLVAEKINQINRSEDEENYEKTKVIKFVAWKYNDQKQVWAGLLQTILYEFQEESIRNHQYLDYFLCFLRENISEDLRKLWGFISSDINFRTHPVIFSASLLIITLWAGAILNIKAINDVLTFISQPSLFQEPYKYLSFWIPFSLVSIISLKPMLNIYNVLLQALGKYKFSFNTTVVKYLKLPDYEEQLGLREEIEKNLDTLIDKFLPENYRLLIIIDELDRCSNENILQVLESLQIFLHKKRITILIGIDQEIISNSLANQFSYLLPEKFEQCQKLNLGYSYLEKFIQLPFIIPNTENYEEYIDHLVKEIYKEPTYKKKSDLLSDKVSEEKIISESSNDKKAREGRFRTNNSYSTELNIKKNILLMPEPVIISDTNYEIIKKVIDLIKPTPRFVKIFVNEVKLASAIMRNAHNERLNQLIVWLGFCRKWYHIIPDVLNAFQNERDKSKTLLEFLDEIGFKEIEEIKQYFEVLYEHKVKAINLFQLVEIIKIGNCFYFNSCQRCMKKDNCQIRKSNIK